ncbi:CcmD family protein [Parapedobacter deserti]|uniref:CcmD family protein n=1 Tax=Parapedobacter deserti TaxID=1912957 RepID=A0ABV7JL36_9SPHI
MKKTILSFILVINGLMCSFAQSNPGVEMATGLRSSGKIYVVVAVLVVLFLGLAIYLVTIDRKLTRLENRQGTKHT